MVVKQSQCVVNNWSCNAVEVFICLTVLCLCAYIHIMWCKCPWLMVLQGHELPGTLVYSILKVVSCLGVYGIWIWPMWRLLWKVKDVALLMNINEVLIHPWRMGWCSTGWESVCSLWRGSLWWLILKVRSRVSCLCHYDLFLLAVGASLSVLWTVSRAWWTGCKALACVCATNLT